jgi:hypothetical protein
MSAPKPDEKRPAPIDDVLRRMLATLPEPHKAKTPKPKPKPKAPKKKPA